MNRIRRKKLRLASGHGWRAQPNHKILVLDRGAVRLEYPETWFVEMTDDCLKIHDKPPPDDDCVLGVSYHHWPAIGRALTVGALLRDMFRTDERSFSEVSAEIEETRVDIALAWGEGRFVDSRIDREACARLCIARKDEIQALLTFDFWLSDLDMCHAHWLAFLASLQLGQSVTDPRRGPKLS